MLRLTKSIAIVAVAFGMLFIADAKKANAQVVTSFFPAQPVVSYMPVRRGLFGLRRGYIPVVSYAAPAAVTSCYVAPAPVTTFYAPAAPVTSFYVHSAPVTTFYFPSAPVVTTPVTTYYLGPVFYP